MNITIIGEGKCENPLVLITTNKQSGWQYEYEPKSKKTSPKSDKTILSWIVTNDIFSLEELDILVKFKSSNENSSARVQSEKVTKRTKDQKEAIKKKKIM